MRKDLLALKILLIPILILGLNGCKKKEESKYKDRFLRVCLSSPVRSLDPRVGVERPSTNVIQMLFEGLMSRDASGGLTEGLAKRIEISNDQKTYTFHLRPSFWSNGDPVTAKDFEYAWKKSIHPATAQLGAYHFNCIKNAAQCLDGQVPIHKVGIVARDDLTLVVHLEHPTPYFLELLACSTYAPIPHKKVLEDEEWAFCNGKPLISNGPFVLKRWQKGIRLKLEKNPSYWRAEEVTISGIFLHVVQENSLRHYLFEQGQIDWMGDPLSPLSDDVIEARCIQKDLMSSEIYGVNWLFLNTKKFPFQNKNFRKALALAIDREGIQQQLLQAAAQKECRFALSPFCDEACHDFVGDQRARAQLLFNSALSEMGIDRSSFPEIKLSYSPLGIHPKLVHLIQNQWEETLGIKVILDPMVKPLLLNQMVQGDYQIGCLFWVSPIADPIYMFGIFRSAHDQVNLSRWVNEDYQKLIIRSEYEQNPEKRKKLLIEVEKFLMEEMPVIPVCLGTALYMKDKKLENVSVSPLMEVDFKYATFVDK